MSLSYSSSEISSRTMDEVEELELLLTGEGRMQSILLLERANLLLLDIVDIAQWW